VIVSRNVKLPVDPLARPVLTVPDANHAVISLLSFFEVPESAPSQGVHPSAIVHPGASLGIHVAIGAHVSVDDRCVIGDNVILHPGVRLYAGIHVGANTIIHANTVIRAAARIGSSCLLHQNVSIGADGFGFYPAPDRRSLLKFPHVGTVVIEDEVEIGANSCVDRAKFGETRIGAGTKIDNLCQIAHNVRIGRGCVIAANCGISGSVTIGNAVRMGGGVGVADHLTIGDGAQVGAMSGVMNNIPAGERWAGVPADEASKALRQVIAVRKLIEKSPKKPSPRP
ncbi:MAG TPA: UDP-3-O-(3-hydroxymyristoyl)glucosamine N-acyltransferase, partial [Phycisphaerales bacterium]|nr:UDP-3-O-(3-hydroxymyristoyl)glucosamine N-acyltransferase [Phycisphaerales bacterium]